MISIFILINFQTNPMIIVNLFTFVHELIEAEIRFSLMTVFVIGKLRTKRID